MPRADTVGNKFEKPKKVQSDKPAVQGKLRITYLGHRGTGGFVNVYPEQHWHSFDTKLANHDATVEDIAKNGFWLPPSPSAINPNLRKFIPPSAIIEISEVED